MKPKLINNKWFIEVFTKEFGYILLLDDSGLPIEREFDTEEDVIEFIYEQLDTRKFEDSYIDMGGHGEPNEYVKQSAEDKRELLYDFMMELIKNK